MHLSGLKVLPFKYSGHICCGKLVLTSVAIWSSRSPAALRPKMYATSFSAQYWLYLYELAFRSSHVLEGEVKERK
jgi:hypothetical protein